MMRNSLLTFFVCLVFSNSLFAQVDTSNFIHEKDLSQHFYYYDLLDNTVLPLVTDTKDKNVLYLFLSSSEVKGKKITFTPQGLQHIYCDGRFLLDVDKETVLNLNELKLNKKQTHTLAFYSSSGVIFEGGVWLVDDSKNALVKTKTVQNQGVLRFQEQNMTSIYVVLILVFVVLGYMRYTQSPYLSAYFDVSKFTYRTGVEDFIYMNPFTKQSILLLFLVALLYAVGLVNRDVFFGTYSRFEGGNLLITGTIILAVVFLKYAYLYLINLLFGGNKIYKVHFFEFARFFALFGLAFLFLSLKGNFFLSGILVVVYLIWLLWLLFELVKKSRYRNVYLFSYLCISELFPVLLLVKIIGVGAMSM